MERKTVKALVQALANLLIIRYLIVEAIRLYKDLPNKLKSSDDVGYDLALQLEPQYYLGIAGLLMTATFGKEGKVAELAFEALKDMVREDIEKLNCSK